MVDVEKDFVVEFVLYHSIGSVADDLIDCQVEDLIDCQVEDSIHCQVEDSVHCQVDN